MVACRYFQQGCCRFGDNCRFDHIYGQKYTYSAPTPSTPANTSLSEQLAYQVISDVNSALKSGQWHLSCYCPFPGKPNMPGLDDVCPEEMRLVTYEARANGRLDMMNSQIAHYCKTTVEKLKELTKPKAVFINAINSLHRGEIPNDPFAMVDFGYPSPNINIFSSNIASPVPTNSFGTQGTATSSNIFANAAKALFQDASNNIFGGQTTQFGTNMSTFSTQMEPASGANSQNSPVGFGGLNQNGLGFGTNMNQSTLYTTNNINNSNNQIFSEPAMINLQPQTNHANGQTSNEMVSASALFGAANAKIQNQMLSQNVFGQKSNVLVNDKNFNSNPFQVNSQLSSSFTQATNILSNNPFSNTNYNSQNTLFQNANEEGLYSNHENLTEQDLQAFLSNSFQHGFIPEIAPSKQLCT